MNRLRLIGSLALLIAAFAAGWTAATWRAGSAKSRALAAQQQTYVAEVEKLTAAANEKNAQTQQHEAALAAQLTASQQQSEALRREILDKPFVVTKEVAPVAGRCPAVPAVDWSLYAAEFNRAATGAEARAADSGNAIVSVEPADAPGGSAAALGY